MFDVDGKRIDSELDQKIEKEWNTLLEESHKQQSSLPPSLGEAIFHLMQQKNLGDLERRVIHWHIANMEYACATDLAKVSLVHWDQDDSYEWAGDHCLLHEGYSGIAKQLTKDLDIRYNTVVQLIETTSLGMRVHTANGTVHGADAVVVTLPLGVLKEG